MPVIFKLISIAFLNNIQLFRNALDYDAVACAAAEGHCNILQYLLSLGQPPNGTPKVVDMCSSVFSYVHQSHYLHTYKLVCISYLNSNITL